MAWRVTLTKIAIFGDSFAANPYLEFSPTTEGFLKEVYAVCNRPYSKKEVNLLAENWGKKYKAWMRYLNADVFGRSGSDLYYSYNQFIQHHSNYEKCIFVITSPLRYSTNVNGWIHCASYEDAVEKIDFAASSEHKQALKTMSSFFKDLYYKDLDRIELLNKAMLDSIQKIRPDTLFINAFPDLKRVYDLELEAWNISHDESQDYTKYFDLRHCHMTNENNKVLADYIISNMNTSGYLDCSNVQWITPTLEQRHEHLVKTQDLFARLI